MAISQNPILPKCYSPKSLLLHFSMNLSETVSKIHIYIDSERIMANCLINFKLSLYIRVNVNEGQNKFEVHILKYLAKIAINWQKIGQIPLGKTNRWAKLGYFSSNFDVLF